MTRQPSPKQAELSSDTTSSSDESPVNIFSRQPPPARSTRHGATVSSPNSGGREHE